MVRPSIMQRLFADFSFPISQHCHWGLSMSMHQRPAVSKPAIASSKCSLYRHSCTLGFRSAAPSPCSQIGDLTRGSRKIATPATYAARYPLVSNKLTGYVCWELSSTSHGPHGSHGSFPVHQRL